MGNILKSFTAVLCAALFLVSCRSDVELLSTNVGSEASELSFAAVDAQAQTIKVTANGDWVAISSDWITIKPSRGTGNTTVTVKVGDNVDAIGIMGPRTGEITIAGTDVTYTVTVNQSGNKKRDLRRDYVKAAKINSGKAYLVTATVDGKILAASPLAASKTYGYLYDPIEVSLKDDKISVENGDNGFVFTEAEGGGYYIQQGSDGRYIYQSGSYDSFNVTKDASTSGTIWDIDIQSDGTAVIKNRSTEKFWQYSTSYSSWGSYAAAGKGEMPVLYEDTKVSIIEVLTSAKTSISVPYDSTHAQFTITTNVDWTVACDSAWITSFTPGGTADEGNPTKDYVIDVNFGQWDNYDEPRTATFTVTGDAKDITLTLTQEKKPAPSYPLPFEETFSESRGLFTTVDVEKGDLSYVWNWASANYGMKASAYANKVNVPAESWLISPAINLANVSSAVLTFDHAYRYTTTPDTDLTVLASSDGENWSNLKIPVYPTGTDWNFVSSGEISLKQFAGSIVYVAFRYQSTSAAAATWEVKNFKVFEGEAECTGISGIRGAIVSTSSSAQDEFRANVTDAVVSYVNGNNVYLEDAEAGILIYKKNHGLTVGQKISGKISGKGYVYNGLKEIADFDFSNATVTDGATPYQTVVTIEKLLSDFDKYDSRRILLEGITMQDGIAKDDRNGVVKQGEFTIPAYAKVNGPAIETDAYGNLVCWPVYNKTTMQVGIWETAHFTPVSQSDAFKIGSTLYPTLAKAVEYANNATEDVKIEMISDYTMDEAANVANVNGKQITIDLAGKTLTCDSSLRLNVTGGVVNLTSSLAGGLIDHTGSSNAIVIKGAGTLNIGENVTVLNESTSAGIYSGAVNTTLNVNGGTVISKDVTKNAVSMSKDGASLSVAGDSYIYGGISVTTTNLTGGYYTSTFKAADGYGFTEVSGIKKTVLGQDYSFAFKIEYGVAKSVAKIGSKLYTSLEAAVADANVAETDVTITLLDDYTMAQQVELFNANSKTVTFDLDGHTLTEVSASSRLQFGGKINVISTTEGGIFQMTRAGSNCFMIVEDNSQVMCKGITIYHPAGSVVTFYSKFNGVNVTLIDCAVIHTDLTKSYAISFTGTGCSVIVSGKSYLYGPINDGAANVKISEAYVNATTTSIAEGATLKTVTPPVTLSVLGEQFSFGYKIE